MQGPQVGHIIEETKEGVVQVQAETPNGLEAADAPENDPKNDLEKDIQHAADMEEYANTVVIIMIPVVITMILVAWAVRNIQAELNSTSGSGMTVYTEKSGDSTGTKFLGSLANAIIIVGVICVVTVVMVLLYKFRCMKVLWGWIMLSTCILLIGFCAFISYLLLEANNLLLDYISWVIVVYNFGVVGMLAVFWHAPTYINQAYLILISAFTAIVFSRLPEWTTWIFLGLIAVYDLFAVLFPKGPLNILLKLSQERNETIPALIYNASVYTVSSPSSKQPANEEVSAGSSNSTLRSSENIEIDSHENQSAPTTNLDLTEPSVEINNNNSSDNKSNENPVEVLRVDSQGNRSPGAERKEEVFVDITLSPSLSRNVESSQPIVTDEPNKEDSTSGLNEETKESEQTGEQRQHRRRHRHHHRHHHHHDPTSTNNSEENKIEGDITTGEPQLGDPTGHDASSHRHRHHHHRHHHHRQREAAPSQKADEIAQSPVPTTSVPPPNPTDPPTTTTTQPPEEEESGGVKLGLGDFIFYSVLIGRAAMYDITTVFTCFIAIITGLFLTLLLLAFFKRPLPALPVSVALGIIFYFLTRVFLIPYIKYLGLRQFFV